MTLSRLRIYSATKASVAFAAGLCLLLASTAGVVLLAEASGTDLGGGINTPTDVADRALISLDLSEMFELIDGNKYNEALNVYEAGKNSPMYDDQGNVLPDKRSLMSMSTVATAAGAKGTMEGEPPFVFHLYGLAGGSCDPNDLDQNRDYADAFVKDAIKERKGTLGAEAARALNLWMYATHELYDGVEDCARIASGINVQAAGLRDNSNGALAMDEFVAFWIGTNQVPGSLDGASLYAMTQQAAAMFGTVDEDNGEAWANTAIKRLYNEASALLSNPKACGPKSETVGNLWSVAHRVVGQMSVPLIQMLVRSMAEQDQDRINLYARAVVPQMSRCRPSAYRRLKEELLDKEYDNSKFLEVLQDLQGMYDCLGLSCADIGAYQVSEVAECAGYPDDYPLAQYSPSSDVHSHAKIDLDVAELNVYLCFDSARSFSMGENLYKYGHNSKLFRARPDDPIQFRSLQEMATTAQREDAPWFTHFLEYHQNSYYADKIISDTLNGRGKWGSSSREQRAEIVIKTVQYHVVFMFLLAQLADAIRDCDNDDANDNMGTVHSWDKVVAFYVGSQEGSTEGGSKDFSDGTLMWNLGNKRCTQFNTENSKGWSEVMSSIEDQFYAGLGELNAYDCVNLGHTVKRIAHLSLIPLMQSVVRYAIKNERHSWNSGSKDLAAGEAFAYSILPILNAYDPIGMAIVEENMVVEEGKEPVMDGAQAVANAFQPIMNQFGLECQFLGQSDGIDFCKKGTSSATKHATIAGSSILSVVVLVVLAILP